MVSSSMTFFHTTLTLNHFKVIYIFILPWKNVDKAFTGCNGYSATSMESVTASRALPQFLFTASYQTALINGGEIISEQAFSLAQLAGPWEATQLPKTQLMQPAVCWWFFFKPPASFCLEHMCLQPCFSKMNLTSRLIIAIRLQVALWQLKNTRDKSWLYFPICNWSIHPLPAHWWEAVS